MKSVRYIILLCLSMVVTFATGQNQEQAKKLFNDGNYAEAKPAFEKLLKRNPKNGSLNYWYGVCLYETGEADQAIPYLKYAVERKVREASRYLAMYYSKNYHFAEAEDYWESYFEQMEKAKKPTEPYQTEYDFASMGRQMMRSVKETTFIDSFVVDKENFLSAYHLSPDAGNLFTYDQFFNEKTGTDAVVYQTEMENKIYYAKQQNDTTLHLYESDLLGAQWGTGTPLKGISTTGEANYPYMLSDGSTFYFAAKGEESFGGYDIFVTRYDPEDNRFLVPENIGMPFNSPANDYMYVIDEYNELGWFATDRRQPEGKVCIYVFTLKGKENILNEEAIPAQTLRNLAQLNSISDTQTDDNEVRKGKQRLTATKYNRPEEEKKKDFELVIDDLTVYHTLGEFRSKEAKALAANWIQERKNLQTLSKKLEEQRTLYARSNAQKRSAMTPALLDLEKRVEELEEIVTKTELDARNAENRHLGKK